ncbi:MAG: hypothetical protein RI907_3497 [Pseudomonadota bacterium]|jgi:hypothetical protein
MPVANWVLIGVSAVLLLLVLRDGWRHRGFTLAMRIRLTVILVFALVMAWQHVWATR